MAPRAYKASAPGSLMLLGEHAVLHRRPCLVGAVNRRIHVALTPRDDRRVLIQSALGNWHGTLDDLHPRGTLRFALAALRARRTSLPSGCKIRIRSEFSDQVGLGSSAAVTVAVHAAVDAWLGRKPGSLARLVVARATIRAVQGCGSGADAAASVYGGLLSYRTEPLEVEPLPGTPPLTLLYCGYKTATPEVIEHVERRLKSCPSLYESIYDLAGDAVQRGVRAAHQGDWPALGNMLDVGQGLMDALGVNTPELAELVFALRARPTILGAKISGSGLGDCVVGLGQVGARCNLPGHRIPIRLSTTGVQCEAV